MNITDAVMAVHTILWMLDEKDIWESSSNSERACKKSPPKHFPNNPLNTDLIKGDVISLFKPLLENK